MLYKLSLRNVKRSFKDYGIYFLTLVLGVCIFYIFNSIESQSVMIDLTEVQSQTVEMMTNMISSISVFISFILGFLIIYANNFMIKRRNKEFGIYMTLGISRKKISFMLFYETLVVGIISLVVGIFIGTFLSQGFAGITASLFKTDLSKYSFIFSKDAALKTILYFSIMFLITMMFNLVIVSKCKLIDLINSGRKNEKLKGTNIFLSFVLFIISIVCLVTAYNFMMKNPELNDTNKYFYTSVILGILGTVLFFRALSGFLIKIIQTSKKQYLKNLNTFTLRQLNSKINTTYVSMSIICLMLFLTIGMLSSATGIKDALESTSGFQTPYSMSFEMEANPNENITTITKNMGIIDVEKYSKESIEYYHYNSQVAFKDLGENIEDESMKLKLIGLRDANIPAIKLSDYNKLMKMQGEKEVSLDNNEAILLSDVSGLKELWKYYVDKNKSISIGEKSFIIKGDLVFKAIHTNLMGENILSFILPDEEVANLTPMMNFLSLNYNGIEKEVEKEVVDRLNRTIKSEDKYYDVNIGAMTRLVSMEMNIGLAAIYIYIGLYIGLIFLLSSAAILALSQLSDAIDSLERYKILKKLGIGSKMINKSIFIQVLLYFMLPLGLALVHSVCGIKVANNIIDMFGDHDTIKTNILTVCGICAVYATYFFATYSGYKRIVNNL